ncbi:MAG: mandelate racemase/muconate lactonizing enzyme family protein [Burkholderiales bacterium]
MPRIARVRAHVLEAPLSEPFAWSFTETSTRGSCVVEVTTEDGLSGWGECLGPARLNAPIVGAYGRMLLGQDALAVDRHWLAMYNGLRDQGMKGLALTALSGVDVALWDLRGRHWGEPVWRRMGGRFRDAVAAYATGTYRRGDGWRTLETRRTAARFGGGDPDALTRETLQYLVDEVAGYAAQGFRAAKLKIGFGVDQDVALVRAVREAVGPRVGLMIDANHGSDAIDAIRLGSAVADLDIGWFEEPVVPDDLDSYVEVRRGQPVPVAGGETEFTRWGFREVLTRRAMDIVQPDICACGGLSEAKKIADMATAFGVRLVPHVWGTGIGLAAALQLHAVLPPSPPRHDPTEPMLEFDRSEHPFRQAVLAEPIEHERGMVRIPDGPGLGVAIDVDAIARWRADLVST